MAKKKQGKLASKKPLSRAGKQARAEKHELFCLEYIKDQNAARAARDAGYSEHTAKEMGYELLTYPHIKKRVRQLLEEQKARVLLSGDEILLGIKELAVSDIRRIFDSKTQCWLPMADWPDDIARCVASIESKELFNRQGKLVGYLKKVKLWEKPKSQENLGRNKGLFKDVIESKGNLTVTTVDEKQVKDLVDEVEKEF